MRGFGIGAPAVRAAPDPTFGAEKGPARRAGSGGKKQDLVQWIVRGFGIGAPPVRAAPDPTFGAEKGPF